MCRKDSQSLLVKMGSGKSLKYCFTMSATSKADWPSYETPSGSDSTSSRRTWMRDFTPDFRKRPTWQEMNTNIKNRNLFFSEPQRLVLAECLLGPLVTLPGPDTESSGRPGPWGCWEAAALLSAGLRAAEEPRTPAGLSALMSSWEI